MSIRKNIRLMCMTLGAVGAGMMQSCIADEPLNAECDILTISLHHDEPVRMFYSLSDTVQTVMPSASEITFTARPDATVGKMALHLTATAGAKLFVVDGEDEAVFSNGMELDFTGGRIQTLRVKSEDGRWHRDYAVSVLPQVMAAGDFFFDFENFHLDRTGSYYEWDVTDENAKHVFQDALWKNGNPGFKLAKSTAKPLEYPSSPVVGGGPDGSSCLKLETMATGAFGAMVNMRFASGSMFNGLFDVSNALKDALKATRFGSPFTHRPKRMTVWMKFEQGEVYQDRQANPMPNVVDEPDAYVVFYRNEVNRLDEDGNPVLDDEGNPVLDRVILDGSEVLSSELIVAVGRLPHHYNLDGTDKLDNNPIHGVTGEWKEFVIDVKYSKDVDMDILRNNGYSIAIDFASSWQGQRFMGAVGNKLYIDNIKIESYADDEAIEVIGNK